MHVVDLLMLRVLTEPERVNGGKKTAIAPFSLRYDILTIICTKLLLHLCYQLFLGGCNISVARTPRGYLRQRTLLQQLTAKRRRISMMLSKNNSFYSKWLLIIKSLYHM